MVIIFTKTAPLRPVQLLQTEDSRNSPPAYLPFHSACPFPGFGA